MATRMTAEGTAPRRSFASRVLSALEVPALVAVPVALAACAVLDVPATAALSMGVAVIAIALMVVGIETDAPLMRQLMPTVVLAAAAAAGRVMFAPLPDIKPVSAICIIAGATLGRRSGFACGALAALVSNFFFGQGAWTPLQMYAWGLVGYVAGMLSDAGAFERTWPVLAWGFCSGLVYGAILNGWHVLGYVRPITLAGTLTAFAAGFPLDVMHGVATVVFLALTWGPWGRAIKRAVAKYDLR